MAASAELECYVNFASVLRCVRSFDFLTGFYFSFKCHLPFFFVNTFVSKEQVLALWRFYYDFVMGS